MGRKVDDGPRSAIARYAHGWSDDKAAAWRELRLIGYLMAVLLLLAWYNHG